MYTLNQFKTEFSRLGYKFYSNGDYNLNIIGVRNNLMNTNTFNDELYVIYKVKGKWVTKCYPITTEPGFKSLTDPINSKGCAIMVPNQYTNCYELGKHKGEYTALVQSKPIKVYRDNNKDKIVNIKSKDTEEGIFGCNIHKAGKNSILVDKWSAGCQVFKKSSDFDEFIKIAKKSAEIYGNHFTYTLLNQF